MLPEWAMTYSVADAAVVQNSHVQIASAGKAGFITQIQNLPEYFIADQNLNLLGMATQLYGNNAVIPKSEVAWLSGQRQNCLYNILKDNVQDVNATCQFAVKQELIPRSSLIIRSLEQRVGQDQLQRILLLKTASFVWSISIVPVFCVMADLMCCGKPKVVVKTNQRVLLFYIH